MAAAGINPGAVVLVLGFPLLLLALVLALGRLEAWVFEPDERAAAVERLLDELDEAEAVEQAAVAVLAPVADEEARRWRESRRIA